MIRLIDRSDLEHFRRIRLEALRLEPAAYHSSAEDWEARPDADWLRRITDHPVFVAFRADEPVGVAGLIREGTRKTAHRASVVMVYVRKDLRGSGLAHGLMDALTHYARDAGIRQLELGVNADNPVAIRFYAREGFREFGRIPCGFIHEEREIDDVLMVRRIDTD